MNALHSLQASRLSPLLSHSFIAGTVKFIGANMECCRRRRYELEESSVEESSSDSDSEHDRRCRLLDFYVSVYRTAYSYSILAGHSHSVAVIIVKCELYSSAIINNKDACNCIMSTKQRRLENLWTTSKVEYAPEQTFVSLLLLWWFLTRSRSAVPYGAYWYYSAHPIVLFLFRFVSIAYGHCDAIIVDICLSVCRRHIPRVAIPPVVLMPSLPTALVHPAPQPVQPQQPSTGVPPRGAVFTASRWQAAGQQEDQQREAVAMVGMNRSPATPACQSAECVTSFTADVVGRRATASSSTTPAASGGGLMTTTAVAVVGRSNQHQRGSTQQQQQQQQPPHHLNDDDTAAMEFYD